jgi:hypothetical protein
MSNAPSRRRSFARLLMQAPLVKNEAISLISPLRKHRFEGSAILLLSIMDIFDSWRQNLWEVYSHHGEEHANSVPSPFA